MVRTQERRARGNAERHAEVPSESEEVRATLTPLFRPGLVRVVEITAEQPQLLHARHHGPRHGIGHGRVEEVVLEFVHDLLEGELHGHGVFRVGRRGDDGLVVAAEQIPVFGEACGLDAQVVHDPQFVVAEHGDPEVDGPDFLPGEFASEAAHLLHEGRMAGPEAHQGDGLGARLEAVGWIRHHHPRAVR